MDNIPIWQVVVMGMVTVFICLICLVILSMLVSAIINAFAKKDETTVAPVTASAPVAAPAMQMPNKQQLIATIGVAIAEDMGTDISHIKIHSVRKI